MLLVSSLLLFVGTVFFYRNGRKTKAYINGMLGKCVAMFYGMVTSTGIGLILTFLMPGDLAVSTVLSVLVAFLFAFLIGGLFGLVGILEASAASFMGAMMGAMLAAMVPPAREAFILLSMDFFYVFVLGGLLYLMGQEAAKFTNVQLKLRLLPLAVILLCTLSAAGILIAAGADADEDGTSGTHSHAH